MTVVRRNVLSTIMLINVTMQRVIIAISLRINILVYYSGVRGRALALHSGVRGFETQRGGRLPAIIC